MERWNCIWTRGPTVGRGSTATVSLATTAQGRLFAVKSAHPGRSLFLQREDRILSALYSPHVVGYLGSCLTHDDAGRPTYNILMDYVPGGTLAGHIDRRNGKGMEEPEIKAITSAILHGLAYVHERHIAHCDVKAENILMGQDGAVLADFGCAKRVDDGHSASRVISGTPSHMSPEAARGEAQGMPADVWALGCTLIEMANGGCSPWINSGDAVATLYRIGFSSAAAPEVPRWLSAAAKDFLAKCLVRDPAERWTAAHLMKHSFVDMSSDKSDRLVSSDSPTTVLDSDFWSSIEDDRSDSSSELERTDPTSSMTALARIGQVSSRSRPDWTWDEDWIDVRGFSLVEDEGASGAQEVSLSLNSKFVGTSTFSYDGRKSSGHSIEDGGSFQLKDAIPSCTWRASFLDIRCSNLH